MTDWRVSFFHDIVAPDITSFVRADIPSLEATHPSARSWMQEHFETAHLASFEHGMKQLVHGLVRRTYHAFHAFHLARRQTLAYLEGNDPLEPRVADYYDAIGTWEVFILQTAMAIDIVNAMKESGRVFEKGDGSAEQRLYSIANQIKHIDKCIRAGQCRETDTVPLWLTNDGIASWQQFVSWREACILLGELSNYSQATQNWLVTPTDEFERYVRVADALRSGTA